MDKQISRKIVQSIVVSILFIYIRLFIRLMDILKFAKEYSISIFRGLI